MSGSRRIGKVDRAILDGADEGFPRAICRRVGVARGRPLYLVSACLFSRFKPCC